MHLNKIINKADRTGIILTRMLSTLLFIIFCFCMGQRVTAQQAVVTLDREQILIGEQVTLQLKVENLTDQAQSVQNWFKVKDTANHIEVVRSGKIDTISVDGQTTLMQKLTITSFDSGSWQIPVIEPVVKDINNQEYTLSTTPVTLRVMPVDVSNLKDFHPVKDILNVDYRDYTWLYITGAVILLGLLTFLIIRWIKRTKDRPKTGKPVVKGPPLAWAMGQIDALEKEKLVEAGKVKEFYTRLLDICRAYFDERLSSHAFQATSKELVASLQAYLVRHKERADMESFASLSDYVKFAEHSPEVEKTKEAVTIARQTLTSVEKQIMETQKKNDR
ncbi:hypothetical protein [Arachidicoccus terrestris]|uniref:hypothetical protein n=1 Tax=Arachidicoccus terrestris TaxID=2875539 RepID=UPI001CC54765|nr:hypothetical protein [Arachidicoccus terrestris]UAY54406.1 hypothetical protein K9M52_13205 [Arachidicoccus terrestris]